MFSEESDDNAAERIYFLKREVLELRDALAAAQSRSTTWPTAPIPYVARGHPGVLPRRLRPPDPSGRAVNRSTTC